MTSRVQQETMDEVISLRELLKSKDAQVRYWQEQAMAYKAQLDECLERVASPPQSSPPESLR